MKKIKHNIILQQKLFLLFTDKELKFILKEATES